MRLVRSHALASFALLLLLLLLLLLQVELLLDFGAKLCRKQLRKAKRIAKRPRGLLTSSGLLTASAGGAAADLGHTECSSGDGGPAGGAVALTSPSARHGGAAEATDVSVGELQTYWRRLRRYKARLGTSLQLAQADDDDGTDEFNRDAYLAFRDCSSIRAAALQPRTRRLQLSRRARVAVVASFSNPMHAMKVLRCSSHRPAVWTVYALAVEMAELERFGGLAVLFGSHRRELGPLRLRVLGAVPETAHPEDYAEILEQVRGAPTPPWAPPLPALTSSCRCFLLALSIRACCGVSSTRSWSCVDVCCFARVSTSQVVASVLEAEEAGHEEAARESNARSDDDGAWEQELDAELKAQRSEDDESDEASQESDDDEDGGLDGGGGVSEDGGAAAAVNTGGVTPTRSDGGRLRPLTSLDLVGWFRSRAEEIDERSGQLGHALALLQIGMALGLGEGLQADWERGCQMSILTYSLGCGIRLVRLPAALNARGRQQIRSFGCDRLEAASR